MLQVQVGIGCFVVRRVQGVAQFLLGQRRGGLSPGTWGLPGGHLDYGESWETCAQRETLEECGISIPKPQFITAANTVFPEAQKHYVTMFMHSAFDSEHKLEQRVQVMEPDKCVCWAWVTWEEMCARKAVFRDACAKTEGGSIELEPLFQSLETLEQMYGSRGPACLESA
ncbi:hypothetical protein IWW50_000960 [Coemansia erecta]|nr:hypothetical protein IWW50_000960 [Coemansia erecta]